MGLDGVDLRSYNKWGQIYRSARKTIRKQYKRKLRSCALCKPHKMAGENRWKPKELAKLKRAEAEIRQASREE